MDPREIDYFLNLHPFSLHFLHYPSYSLEYSVNEDASSLRDQIISGTVFDEDFEPHVIYQKLTYYPSLFFFHHSSYYLHVKSLIVQINISFVLSNILVMFKFTMQSKYFNYKQQIYIGTDHNG